ncbi:DUF488 domain-containing protein [Acidocella aminolytica]|jgi:uncharacterized protein YeaO (DUF488 family)|uniref:DUF488 domain-containing protein n=1 Tax=Acidocella aminolytica 101 = DSM 11237 TaxID=1120923 RepID=A0A0D6PH82_9PROT|nr:DUF488 domain-containing protein [Acidocella aminolytica]GAN81110.1 hypothetical protein Aam_076_015 [Acidocella aminolytica 101 = DSM 11237]GBQ32758.1 hypothetical protein AA11237_0245 [Acidocella aminolytica 101 = DSM 11237]SHF48448.1 Uncharacterized conserved protein YeaO, DUF488 family [Acidocella aminolytica 101 = DSM 11237]
MTAKHANLLKIKRVYETPGCDDGARVLVDRLWPRGLKKEKAALHLWLKDVAPSPGLRQWFGHDPSRWQDFRQLYCAELARNSTALDRLAALWRQGPVTLLYAAHDAEHNHARVLADYLTDHLQ